MTGTPRIVGPSALFADGHLLVVNKPARVLSVPGRGDAPNLVGLLKTMKLTPLHADLRIVHRLDRGASGVMVLARTLEAQRALTEQFVRREVEKVYLALVQGFVVGDGEVDLPLRVNRDKARVEVDRKSGKPSHTQYRIVERVHGHTFLECRPLTGRLHQIRVHLAAIGHPLAVDRKYGGARAILLSRFKTDYKPSSRHPERPLIDRLTLHAARLTFTHPATHERLTFEAPLPKDLRATLNQLRRLAPAPPFNAA